MSILGNIYIYNIEVYAIYLCIDKRMNNRDINIHNKKWEVMRGKYRKHLFLPKGLIAALPKRLPDTNSSNTPANKIATSL